MSKLPKVLQSSQNQNELSMTIKGLLLMILPAAMVLAEKYGYSIPEAEWDNIITVATSLLATVITLRGIFRKYRK